MNDTRLQKEYKTKEDLRAVLDSLESTKKDAHETNIDELDSVKLPNGQEMERWQKVKALQLLDDVGAGQFKSGRRGYPTRLMWHRPIKEVIQIARGKGNSNENANGKGGQVDMLQHQFPVRENCVIQLSLPANLTTGEAARLNQFIQALAVK
jgi:hypothetical protein